MEIKVCLDVLNYISVVVVQIAISLMADPPIDPRSLAISLTIIYISSTPFVKLNLGTSIANLIIVALRFERDKIDMKR